MKWILLTALFFCLPLNAKTVKQYINQYKNIPCSGIIAKNKDIDKKYPMGNKNKKMEYRKQKKALKKLHVKNDCAHIKYR
jgi:hypothetical protein